MAHGMQLIKIASFISLLLLCKSMRDATPGRNRIQCDFDSSPRQPRRDGHDDGAQQRDGRRHQPDLLPCGTPDLRRYARLWLVSATCYVITYVPTTSSTSSQLGAAPTLSTIHNSSPRDDLGYNDLLGNMHKLSVSFFLINYFSALFIL